MRATPANVALAAGSGVVVGVLAAKVFGARAEREADEDALFEEAFETAATTVAQHAGVAFGEAELDTVSRLIKEEEAKEDDLPAVPKPAPAAPAPAPQMPPGGMPGMPPPPTEDQVKGIVETKADGSRVFKRPELGIEFEVGKKWLGLDEFVQPTPNGATWMARFGDPAMQGGPPLQLTMVVEHVPQNVSVEEYVAQSKRTCEESMGSFAQTAFEVDRPHKQGVFTRLLEYTQTLPMDPTGMSNGPMVLKNVNLMTVGNGLAITLQYTTVPQFFDAYMADLHRLADSVKLFESVRRYGKLVRRNKGVTVALGSQLGYLLYPPGAAEGPPQSLIDCFLLNGTLVDTYTPTGVGSPISVIVDAAPDASGPQKLAAMVLAELPDQHKENTRVFFPTAGGADDCLEYVVEHLPAPSVPSGKCAVVVYMQRLAPTVRVAIWCKAEEKPGDDPTSFPWLQPSERDDIKAALQAFAKAVQLPHAEGDAAEVTTFECDHSGFSMRPGAKGQVKELSVGEICASYQLFADKPTPELQIIRQDRKESLEAWRAECKRELETQLHGQCQEEGSGFLGREEMRQLVFRVPQPPMDGNFSQPQILCCFLTLLNTHDASWLLQWRCSPPEFDRHRDDMEEILKTFSFRAASQ